MTTTPRQLSSELESTAVPSDSASVDHMRYLGRWLNTWVAFGAVVILVVITYLALISSALVKINGNLAATSSAVTGVAGRTKTLPGQLAAVNSNLAQINDALSGVPRQATVIESNLGAIESSLGVTNTALSNIAPNLKSAASNLDVTASVLGNTTSALSNTSSLLHSVLGSTDSISKSLSSIEGGSRTEGVRGINSSVSSTNGSLAGTHSSLGNILSTLDAVNGHLTNVCKSVPINLLHGHQPC